MNTPATAERCPGCGRPVTLRASTESPPVPGSHAQEPPGRWSLAWRPPSGEMCAACGFPIARYRRRRPWILTFRVGVAFATLAILLQLGVRFGGLPAALVTLVRITGVAGALMLLVGGIGLVVGGRRPGDTG